MLPDVILRPTPDVVVRVIGSRQPRVTLVCFPPAGGHSVAFKPLARHVPAGWCIWAVDPPGRALSGGVPRASVEALVDCYERALVQRPDGPMVLLGHSFGGVIVYELSRRLHARGWLPASVILCAAQPPHLIQVGPKISDLDDEALLGHLVRLGGIPTGLLAHRALVRAYLPAIRADLRAYEAYTPSSRAVMPCQALLVGGLQDDYSRPWHIAEWRGYWDGAELSMVDGGHFFVQDQAPTLAQKIGTKIGGLLDPEIGAWAR